MLGTTKCRTGKLANEKVSKWQKKFNDKFRFDKSKNADGMIK